MAIRINKDKNIFALDGKNTSYVFGIEDNQYIRHLHWGKKINNIEDFRTTPVERIDSQDAAIDVMPEEYPPFGGLRYKSTAIKASFADGTRDIVFTYLNYSIENDTLVIRLKDAYYGFYVNLYYRMFEELDILQRWVDIENKDKNDVVLEHISSASFNLDGTYFWNTQVSGHAFAEQQIFREKLYRGKKIFESRKGLTGNNHSPYFILDKNANEGNGEVYFGVLAYSGNFSTTIEMTQFHSVRILMGINAFDFQYRLKQSQKFTTPSVYSGYTSGGFSDMSNALHEFCRKHLMPKENSKNIHPVLYNSWEATKFDISVSQQITLAKKAAKAGVELFVVDDGWFGERNSDNAGLGDWVVNKKKFPRGLKELVDKVNDLGMDFGIWVEPEAVNPDSDLYRTHPEWIYHFKHRTPSITRNQYVLNVTRKDVQQYILEALDKLLTDNNIAYLKWDMNRPISEPGARNLQLSDQRSTWYRHTIAVYKIVDQLRKKHPRVTFEACASGGSRIDYGSLQHFDQIWLSDNTDAHDRLFIQEGYSYIYPIKAMRAWVTDCPNKITHKTTPLEFRFHSAMMGILGLGGNLTKYTKKELEFVKEKVAEYKRIRHIIQDGQVYRLKSLTYSHVHAVQYVYKQNESALFVFLPRHPYIDKYYLVKLKGFDPDKLYEVEMKDTKWRRHGDYLMNAGIEFTLMGDYQSEIVHIKAI